ncbi:hypothetical protein AC477_01550 [miscellaneous Crenarchaeota group-1 archaeon SG8-32-1]|uniref:CARDB domain-containing protein n=1 Tax=miscellaneous Crenarchaeota group-1 archaeon SG8-32-1 TaxID=1685124 RepID=A0A0M0BZ99_9ARCH|nr:MAG: hypothetical protein AC477_01550 [miscellaneous Crenarchaeota group-1 archaeon SG8-32-1]
MKSVATKIFFVVFILSIILFSPKEVFTDETLFQIESTDLQIYRDGLVRISQTLFVNETFPVITLSLLNSSVSNFIVLDENHTVLDYEVSGINLTVFTLGTKIVTLQYDTNSLTKKDFEVWSLILNTPYNLTVSLPEESTIIYMNEIPSSIDLVENKMTLSLYQSSWEIGYVFSSIIPLDFQVTDLNVNPSNPKVGEEVTVSVKVTNVGEQIGSYTIPFVVNQTTEETKTLTLESGESSIITFKIIKQIQGIYTFDVGGIYGTFEVEPSNNISSTSFPLEYVIILIVTVTAVFFVAILLFKRRKVNVDKIFKLNPQLNKEEKDVIQFLADNEAKAFESIIRDKFPDIPRTSLWRMVKRLEKLEIVKVKKIGLENQVELKK